MDISTITPANVSFNIDGKATSITDAQLNLSLSNNCHYKECVLDDGKKGYLLTKGAEITRSGAVKVQTVQTGDGKSDDAINTIREKQKLADKSDDPQDYSKPITFSFTTPGGKTFANISFEGFVKEYKDFDPVGTAPPTQEAEIELQNPLTLKIDN